MHNYVQRMREHSVHSCLQSCSAVVHSCKAMCGIALHEGSRAKLRAKDVQSVQGARAAMHKCEEPSCTTVGTVHKGRANRAQVCTAVQSRALSTSSRAQPCKTMQQGCAK